MLKKNFIFLQMLIALVLTSCSQEVQIQGNVKTNDGTEILLYTLQYGTTNELIRMPVDSNGYFNITFPLSYEGVYLIGQNISVLYPVYLKKRENIELNLYKNHIELLGENNPENQALEEWEKRTMDIRTHAFLYKYITGGRSVGEVEFFEELKPLFNFRKEFLSTWEGTNNDRFDNFLKKKIDADMAFYVLAYLKNNKISDSEWLSEYHELLRIETLFNDKEILNIPYAGMMLKMYVWYLNKNRDVIIDESVDDYICFVDKDLQQEYLLTCMEQFKYYDQYKKVVDQFEEDFFTPPYKDRLQKLEDHLAWSKPGVEAFDFRGMRPDSTWMSLSDCIGNIVVVDVWATWCEPCRRMMPYFQQLEQEMENENIIFMSVCIGASVERDLWLDILQKETLFGNQLFVDSWLGDFAKKYRVTGVPRYMIFDKKGCIISLAAPKPTNPELREMIQKALIDD